jgi:hypothetical protein
MALSNVPVASESIEPVLPLSSDKIVFIFLGMPGGPVIVDGKEALRASMQSWAAHGTSTCNAPLCNRPACVLVRLEVANPELDALRVAPMEASTSSTSITP